MRRHGLYRAAGVSERARARERAAPHPSFRRRLRHAPATSRRASSRTAQAAAPRPRRRRPRRARATWTTWARATWGGRSTRPDVRAAAALTSTQVELQPDGRFGLGLRLEDDQAGLGVIVGAFTRRARGRDDQRRCRDRGRPRRGAAADGAAAPPPPSSPTRQISQSGRLPAEACGAITLGDYLVAVDSEPTHGMPLADVVKLVQASAAEARDAAACTTAAERARSPRVTLRRRAPHLGPECDPSDELSYDVREGSFDTTAQWCKPLRRAQMHKH